MAFVDSQSHQSLDSVQALLQEKARIEELYGPWTAHRLPLRGDVYTMDMGDDWAYRRGKWFGLIGEIMLRKPLKSMRALDIGCLEGGVSLALGEGGASVIGIDVREANLAKAAFTRDALGLSNVEFAEVDMLQLPASCIGSFDLIVCAGTLYHIDAPQLLPFLRDLRAACSGIVIFDSHVAVERREQFVGEQGNLYYGRTFVETHHQTNDLEEKKKDRWGSLHNNLSFWLTERSLINMLIDAGFEFVVKPVVPVMEWPWQDRGFWVAYSSVDDLLSEPYTYGRGRLSEPNDKPTYHEMLDNPVQQTCTNPHTKRILDS